MISRNVVVNGIQDVVIKEEELNAEHLNENECLIESEVSLISPGTELSRVFGLKKGASYPMKPGYCSVGTILAAGSKITQAKKGDRVLFSGPHASCQIYDLTKSDGGVLYPLNKETSPEEGAFLMMCWIAMNGILPAEVKLTDTVAILGMGNLGLILAVYYKQMGVRVIAADPVKHRCEVAGKMGIEEVIDCPPSEQVKTIMDMTDGQGADIVVDASGISACVVNCIDIAAKYGQVLLLGSPRTDYEVNVTPVFNQIHMKMLTVIGAMNRRYPLDQSEGSRLSINKTMKYIESLLNKKILDVRHLISHRVKPEEIMSAYDGLMNKKEEYTSVIVEWK